jgi:orotidine-5'-phosphate decarboxylase
MKKFKAFIALDCETNNENIRIVKKLSSQVFGFKVGYRSFYSKGSDTLLAEIKKSKCPLFLDLKLHDIPNTVTTAITSLSKINPDYLTLHISGGKVMLEKSLIAIRKHKLKTKLLGVTLLTSLDNKDSKLIFSEKNTNLLVHKLANIANDSKIHGLICSGQDLDNLKKFKKLIKITPGVKLFARKDDQKRVTFVHEALINGADYVVIGREIIESKNPLELLKKYYEENKNKDLWTN